MNKLFTYSLLLSLVFLFSCSKDEDGVLLPSDTYVKYYGNSYLNEAHEMIQTSDGGFILAGTTDNSSGKKSIIVVKVAANGNEEWSKTYNNTGDEISKHITTAIDGGYIVASTQTDLLGRETIYLTHINSTGDVLWKKDYFSQDSTSIEKVFPTSSGDYMVLANTTKYDSTNNNTSGFSDVMLMRVNVLGDSTWSKQYGGSGNDIGYDIEEKNGLNGFVIVGSSNTFQPPGLAQLNAFIFEINNVGNAIAPVYYGGFGDDAAYEVETVADGYLICGETQSNGSGAKDVYYFKTELNIYNLVFERYFGGQLNEIGNCITTTISGDYLIGASTESFGEGANDGYLIKVDAGGNEIFNSTYGGTGDENINDIISLDDGKIMILGSSNLNGNRMISLTKTKEDGSLN